MSGLGVLFGILGAGGQSAAYLVSRRFIVNRRGSPACLLVLSHTLLGVAALVVLALAWDERLAEPTSYAWLAAGAGGFYLLGQGALFGTLRLADASRVVPLLGLKVVAVALLWVTVMGEKMGPAQWVAVLLAVGAAFVLNHSGGKLPLRVTGPILFTCFCYGLSDLHIVRLVPAMGVAGSFAASVKAVSVCYVVCGAVSVALLPWLGSRRLGDWRAAVPYAVVWYAAMLLLFTALATAGPVLANIALSTRGLWSIGLGALLAALGWEELERKTPRRVVLRRAAAALLMILAIGLYEL